MTNKVHKKSSVPSLDLIDLPFISFSKYYLREAILAVAIFVSMINWSDSWSLLQLVSFNVWVIILFSYAVIASFNSRTEYIPNILLKKMLLPFACFFAVLNLVSSEISISSMLLGFLLLGGIPYILFQISKGEWIGGGVVKILAISGVILGFYGSVICLAIMLAGSAIMLTSSRGRKVELGWLIFISVALSKIITLIS